jgi:hypothetical protein
LGFLLSSGTADRIESALEAAVSNDFNVLSMITDVVSCPGGLDDTMFWMIPKRYGVVRVRM